MNIETHIKERKRMLWTRWITAVIIATSLSIFLSTYIVRDNEIAGCKRDLIDRSALIDHLRSANDALGEVDPEAQYETQLVLVELSKLIVNCEEEYPPIIPWIK
jgi:hypothetical protein